MGNDTNKEIAYIVGRYRKKRAARCATPNDAIGLAKDAELILASIAEATGSDSDFYLSSSTMVASEMLNILVDSINLNKRSPQKALAGALRALEYIDRIPIRADFREERYLPQRQAIAVLAERYGVRANSLGVSFMPTIGDDECYKACSTYDDYSRYIHRHPGGKHYQQARAEMERIKRHNASCLRRKRTALHLITAMLGAGLVVALCLVLGLHGLSIVGVLMVVAAVVCAFYMLKPGADDESCRSGRRLWLGISAVVLGIGGVGGILMESVRQQRAALDEIIENSDEDGLMAYLSDGTNTFFADEALAEYLNMMDSIFFNPELMSRPAQIPPLARMENFSKSDLLSPVVRNMLSDRVKERTDSLYRMTQADGSLEAWQKYQSLAPSDFYYDSSQQIDSIEDIWWSREPTAWQRAVIDNTRESYTRYIDTYPNGAHASVANSRLIDFEVKDYRNQGQSIVDSIDRVADFSGGGSVVEIFNKSEYDVTFLFSGPESVRFTIKPQQYYTREMSDGTYHVLAQVDNPIGDRFAFTQILSHGIYSSTIDIAQAKSE